MPEYHSQSRTVGSLKNQCVETHESIELRLKGRAEHSERQRESEQCKEGLLASPNSTEVSIRILELLLLPFSQGLRSLPGQLIEKHRLSHANSIFQPVDLCLLSPAVSAYTAA